MFFTQVKQGENAVWRYITGVVLVVLGLGLGQVPLGIALMVASERAGDKYGSVRAEEMVRQLDFEGLGIGNNLALVLLILSFATGILALWFTLKFIHERKLISLITPHSKVNLMKILFGFGVWMALTFLAEIAHYIVNPGEYQLSIEAEKFIPLVLIAFILLPIQTTCEELFTRGYLMQAFGLATGNKWIPLLLTSVIFASLHIFNPEVEQYGRGLMILYYMSAGLVLGLLTILDDSLELAIGVHAATNIYAAVFVSYEGSALQTDALFKTTEVDMGYSLVLLLAISLIFMVICAIKYRWTGPLKALFRPITFQSVEYINTLDTDNYKIEDEL
jgi:hypothetical protein